MNREIKFRGQRSDNGQWVYGSLVYYSKNSLAIFTLKNGGHDVNIVKPETVGQFTGLYDKNGKEIYEGDFDKYNCFVNYYRGAFILEKKNSDSWCLLSGVEDFEVIGNIYENADLLSQ